MVGENILGYNVDEEIGSGRFGTVYKVSKTNAAGTYVRALKHISIPTKKQYTQILNSMGGDRLKVDAYFNEILSRLVGEIKINNDLSSLGVKNIVRYYEHDIVERNNPKGYDVYILMEYLTPLSDYVFQKEIKVKDVIKMGKDILTALIYCHNHNIIHRDIKDDNIFVSEDGIYKLGDFGESKLNNNTSQATSIKGTPNYIAPEVYMGEESYDETVDLYSLGTVLYKLLNKSRIPFLPKYPFKYTSEDENIAFSRRMKGDVPDLPYDAQNILGEAIIKAICGKNNRYKSDKEFYDALSKVESKLSNEELNTVINRGLIYPEEMGEVDERHVDSELDKTIELEDVFEEIESSNAKEEKKSKYIIIIIIVVLIVLILLLFIGKKYIFDKSVSSNDISIDSISSNDTSINAASGNDISGNDISANDISGNDISANDISGNDISGDDVSIDSISEDSESGDTTKNKEKKEDKKEKSEKNDAKKDAEVKKQAEPKHVHSYAANIEVQPRCTTNGVKRFKCSCGDSYTEAISMLGHEWVDESYSENIHHEATGHYETVEEEGKYVCNDCGYSTGSSSSMSSHLSSMGHSSASHTGGGGGERFVEDSPAYDETVTHSRRVCARCGAVEEY